MVPVFVCRPLAELASTTPVRCARTQIAVWSFAWPKSTPLIHHVLRGRNTNSGSSDSFASSNGMAAGAIMSSSLLPERPQLARERAVNDLRTPDARFRIEELERVL